MVRVNIINPKYLTDQHLIAEYLEILMLVSAVKNHPTTSLDKIPKNYKLGTGHILFFKNKLKYLQQRHEKIKREMLRRGFAPKKKLSLAGIPKSLLKGWKASSKDKQIIKKRLIERINRKPQWYTYYKQHKSRDFLVNLIKKAD